MFRRPHFVIVTLLHTIALFMAVLANRDSYVANYLSPGVDDPFSRFMTLLLGREFNTSNLVAGTVELAPLAIFHSLYGLLVIWFSVGCHTHRARCRPTVAACVWTCFWLVAEWGYPFPLTEMLTTLAYLMALWGGACVVVILWRRGIDSTTSNQHRISLWQAMVLVTCIAVGLTGKHTNDVLCFVVTFAVLVGLASCNALWMWRSSSIRRAVAGILMTTLLGAVPYLTVDEVAGEPLSSFTLTFTLAVLMYASGILLGPPGRKEIGIAGCNQGR